MVKEDVLLGSVSSRCSRMSPRSPRGLIPEQRLDTEPNVLSEHTYFSYTSPVAHSSHDAWKQPSHDEAKFISVFVKASPAKLGELQVI